MQNSRKSLVLALLAICASQHAAAGFSVVQEGSEPAPMTPIQVITEVHENNRLRADLMTMQNKARDYRGEMEKRVAVAKEKIAKRDEEIKASKAEAEKAKAEAAAVRAASIPINRVSITFAAGSDEFVPQPDAIQRMRLQAPRAKSIIIRGFADSAGTSRKNQDLAMRRALAAEQFLLDHGIADSKIKVTQQSGAYIAKNSKKGGMAANRRVEIEFQL